MSAQQRSPQLLLTDMLDSCEFIVNVVTGRTRAEFLADRLFRGGIERELMIIGEALFQLNREHPEIAALVPEYQKIIGFRHVLVHAYAILDREKVWDVVENKLGELRLQLKKLLEAI